MPVILLGVDPHKSTHTAVAVAPEANRQLASVTVGARLPEYRRLLTWARKWPERMWAVENANGLGRHLAQWLLARGERVVDVPATVACLHGDGREVGAEDHATALASTQRTYDNSGRPRPRGDLRTE